MKNGNTSPGPPPKLRADSRKESVRQLHACLRALKRKLPAVCREAEGKREPEIREIIRRKLIPVVDRYFPKPQIHNHNTYDNNHDTANQRRASNFKGVRANA
jgi:hypothetical protein